jgi:hypothetical protein
VQADLDFIADLIAANSDRLSQRIRITSELLTVEIDEWVLTC